MKARQELCHRIRVFQNKNKNTYVCQKYICMSEIHMYVRIIHMYVRKNGSNIHAVWQHFKF